IRITQHRYAVAASAYHRAAPIHETGHQLMQTGRLFRIGEEYPHIGSVVAKVRGAARAGAPPFALVPRPISNTGVSIGHGQSAGSLGEEYDPLCLCADPARMIKPNEMVDAVDRAQRIVDANESAYLSDRDEAGALATLFAPHAKQAFDLQRETNHSRRRYGMNTFGQSCLTARRLVESGVRLV